jgi:hypothetical protein
MRAQAQPGCCEGFTLPRNQDLNLASRTEFVAQ